MKALARLVSALSIAAVLGASAAFAAAPPAKTTAVKAHSFVNKKGHMVNVKAHTRVIPAKAHVKGYTKTLKSGKTVSVKGYTRKAPMKKGAKPGSAM